MDEKQLCYSGQSQWLTEITTDASSLDIMIKSPGDRYCNKVALLELFQLHIVDFLVQTYVDESCVRLGWKWSLGQRIEDAITGGSSRLGSITRSMGNDTKKDMQFCTPISWSTMLKHKDLPSANVNYIETGGCDGESVTTDVLFGQRHQMTQVLWRVLDKYCMKY